MEYKNNYPCIFVHGLMGYGDSDIMDKVFPNFGLLNRTFFKHLKERGIEAYNPSVGPINSAWDRACIIWAYLFGGRVDYGKVHSEKYGHARYGREFPGVLKDLGQTEAHKKINIIGHSFGGPTVKTVAALFAFGSEEERNGTPPEELSPLFAGGHGDLLHTVTTLSGVNNGTTLASFFGNAGMSIATYALMGFITIVGNTPFTKFLDYSTAQWGNMPLREDVHGIHLQNLLKYPAAARAFDRNKTFDSIFHEMQIEVVQEYINPSLQYPKNTYYFAQRADGTKSGKNGKPVPNIHEMIPPCWLVGQLTGNAMLKRLAKYGLRSDPDWRRNDGLVNLVGQSAPLNTKYEEADYNTDFKPGIWYNMPPERGDHSLWVGWFVPAEKLNAIYDRMIDLYRSLPDGE
ncbi:MAG: hypothetical protein IKX52_00545 [Clostridia bacterium]|nr:hypothetical protein [Clostridia bacterium]